MKQHILTALLLSAGLCLSGCAGQTNTPHAPEKSPVEDNFPKQNLAMVIDGTTVEVHWEDNDTVSELLAYTQNLSYSFCKSSVVNLLSGMLPM